VRAIGIDVSERRGNHVCVLELARPAAGPPATRAGGAGQLADAAAANWHGGRLQATFHPPAEATAVVAAVRALGPEVVVAIDAPSGPTRGLLGPRSAARRALGLPAGRYTVLAWHERYGEQVAGQVDVPAGGTATLDVGFGE